MDMAGLGSVGGVMATDLPRLTEETELQKLLMDEKMRAEQHKTNYQTLKLEHQRLQDEYVKSQGDLKQTLEESKMVRDHCQKLVDKRTEELTRSRADVEQMKSQVMTPQRLQTMKDQVVLEVEAPYREKFLRLERDANGFREECNKLKYEYNFLKSEYEQERQMTSRIMEQTKLRYEAEVKNLRKDRESLVDKMNSELKDGDGAKARDAQRQVAQLNIKVKGLLGELEELRAQREHQGVQADNVSRLQKKQLAESAANIKALEAEKHSLKSEVESLRREVTSSRDQHSDVTAKNDELRNELITIRGRYDELQHQSKVAVANVKMEMLKERGELERERDRLKNDAENMKAEVELGKQRLLQYEGTLVEKEHEAAGRVQAAREEEWAKLHQLENEKLDLEAKVQELERRRIDEETMRHSDRDKLEERVREAKTEKEVAEKEALVVRTKLSHLQSQISEAESEHAELAELRARTARLQNQQEAQLNSEQELLQLNSRYKSQLEALSDELGKMRDHMKKEREEVEKSQHEQRITLAEEKLLQQKKMDEADLQLMRVNEQLDLCIKQHKKKKKRYLKLCMALKERTQLQEARIEELGLEKEALKKQIPSTDVHLMKKQLHHMVKKSQQFKELLLSGTCPVMPMGDTFPISGRFMPHSTPQPVHYNTFPRPGFDVTNIEQGSQRLKDLERVQQRCEVLSDEQKQVERELKGDPRAKDTSDETTETKPPEDLRLDDLRLTESEKETNLLDF